MNRIDILKAIHDKQSILCVGLDPDVSKLPIVYPKDIKGITAFCKDIVKNTYDKCIAYKPNLAFFETYGSKGWEALEEILNEIPKDCFTIADAKRGDIGNTSKMYAQTFFEYFGFDAVTVAPYMGEDSIRPFLDFEGKWTIVLGLTSNAGSNDFQRLKLDNGRPLYQEVISKVSSWGNEDNMMFVIGATHPIDFKNVRQILHNHFLLVPGVGAQGGSIKEVVSLGRGTKSIGLFVNASRSILYASNGEDCMVKAREEVLQLNKEFN
ncbi:MAG TPA: orotidine-5'-phosphate decarboxylase, partial [Saprospiraceae bacterium]|nr:orotidine-5'-phosphate decarboxylase [Saprospiraceae bacterium]